MVKEVTKDFNESECMLGAYKNNKIKVLNFNIRHKNLTKKYCRANFWINVTMFSRKGTLLLEVKVSEDYFISCLYNLIFNSGPQRATVQMKRCMGHNYHYYSLKIWNKVIFKGSHTNSK